MQSTRSAKLLRLGHWQKNMCHFPTPSYLVPQSQLGLLTICTSMSSCNINMNHLPLQASELMTDWTIAGNRIPTPLVDRMESTCSLIILSRKPLSTETPRPRIYKINIIPSLSKQFTDFLKCLQKDSQHTNLFLQQPW